MPYPHSYKAHKANILRDSNFWKKTNNLAGRDVSYEGQKKTNQKHNAYMKSLRKQSLNIERKITMPIRIGGYNEKPITMKSRTKAINAYKNNPVVKALSKRLGSNSSSTAKKVYPDYPNLNTYYSGSSGRSASGSGNPFSEWDYLRYLSDTNTAVNIAMNRENNAFSAEQAKLQRDWETEMSNTAHQREVADLQAAGLNPILSVNAGAAVPAGASAGASNFNGADTSYVNALAGILESTLQANATMTAASMNAAANMYGANKSYEASTYSTDKQSVYGLVGDVIHAASMIATGGAGAYGAVKAAGKTKRTVSTVNSTSHSVNHNYSHRGN